MAMQMSNSTGTANQWSQPAASPPAGVVPNFENPANLQIPIYAVTISCFVLITFAVGIRIYTKWRLLRNFVVEDGILIVAWLVYAFAYNILTLLIAGLPGGVHQWELNKRQFRDGLYYFHIKTIMYSFVIIPLKVSILLQFLRVFSPSGSKRSFTFWSSHILIWLNVIFYVAITGVLFFGCKPFAKAWDPTIENGFCVDIYATNIAAGVFNTISDIMMLVIPVHAVIRLQMPKGQKQALFGIFFLAGIACLFAGLRLHHTIELRTSDDVSFHSVLMGIWSIPEIAAGFMVACAPCMRKFFTRHRSDSPTQFPSWTFNTVSFRKNSSASDKLGLFSTDSKDSEKGATYIAQPRKTSKGAITHVTYEERRNGSYCEDTEIKRTDWALKEMEAGVNFGDLGPGVGHRGPPQRPKSVKQKKLPPRPDSTATMPGAGERASIPVQLDVGPRGTKVYQVPPARPDNLASLPARPKSKVPPKRPLRSPLMYSKEEGARTWGGKEGDMV